MSTDNLYTTWIYRSVVTLLLLSTIGWLALQYQARVDEQHRSTARAHFQSLETEARSLLASDTLGDYEPGWRSLLVSCPAGVTDRFDQLLSQLGTGLTTSELQFLATHASHCTGAFAREQQLRAARLKVLVQEMARVQDIHFPDTTSEDVTALLSNWQALVPLETTLGEQYSTLVRGQRDLILARLEGEPVSGAVVSETLATVSEASASSSNMRTRRAEIYSTLGL